MPGKTTRDEIAPKMPRVLVSISVCSLLATAVDAIDARPTTLQGSSVIINADIHLTILDADDRRGLLNWG